MEKFFFLFGIGAAVIGGLWLAYLVLKHGWGWVLAQWRALKVKLEGRAKAKAAALADKVKAERDALLGPIEKRLAALEAAVLSKPAAAPAPAGGNAASA